MRYIVVLRGTNVIGAKDSAFILLRLRRNSPGLAVREIHPEGWGLPASSFAIPRVKFIANPFYIAAAFLILFLVSGGFAAISILVASIMKTRERFMGLGQALIMPLFFASNALYPIDMMPSALQLFAVLNPLTYAVDAIRGLMISGELSNLTVDVLAILAFDVVVFALASLSFRKILE